VIQFVTWVVFGVIVGSVAKWFYPVDDGKHGMLATLGVGVVGSFVGGLASYVLAAGHSPYNPAGFVFAIVGAVATLAAWNWYSQQQ